jgi:hypothetical protein
MIKSRKMRWNERVALMGAVRNEYNVWVLKPEGRGLHGRPRCRWEDNIKMDI